MWKVCHARLTIIKISKYCRHPLQICNNLMTFMGIIACRVRCLHTFKVASLVHYKWVSCIKLGKNIIFYNFTIYMQQFITQCKKSMKRKQRFFFFFSSKMDIPLLRKFTNEIGNENSNRNTQVSISIPSLCLRIWKRSIALPNEIKLSLK